MLNKVGLVVIFIVLIAQSVLIGIGYKKIDKLESTKSNQSVAPQSVSEANASTALMAASMSVPAVAVSEQKVYLPELRIALPLNETSVSLLYAGRQVGNAADERTTVYDATTRALATQSTAGSDQRLACYPVRLAFEEQPKPFNPNEKANTPVKLKDGRTLQVYTASDSTCEARWNVANVKPAELAKLFAEATSY